MQISSVGHKNAGRRSSLIHHMLGSYPHQQPPDLLRLIGPTQLRIPEAHEDSFPPAVLLQQLHQPLRLRVPQCQLQDQLSDSSDLAAVPEATENTE